MRTIMDRDSGPLHVVWAACGAIVVGYVFLAALGAFEPGEVLVLTIAVVAVAAAVLAHEWREQFRDEGR
jgi:membrane protein implicated in regulation of membrane protease activity